MVSQVAPEVTLIDSLEDVPDEVSRLRGYQVDVGFDLETTDTDPINSRIITIALKPKGKRAMVIDVRHFSDQELLVLGAMLDPLFDGSVAMVGQNLKFDFEFILSQLSVSAHRAYDVMLADQLILGLGVSSANEKNIHFDMLSIGQRYGIPVEKESRNWFIHLDERPEWNEPLPIEQVRYIRQDVSVVHKIKDIQAELIKKYGLEEVIDIEMRALFAVAGIEYYGVQINRSGWLGVISRVKARADELERTLHLGTEDYDGLDVHILRVREAKWREKMEPYEKWATARDQFIAERREVWEGGGVPGYKNWSEYKKATLEGWYEEHGKLTKPPALKQGVNLGSWMQVRDGFNDLGIPVKGVSEDELTLWRDKHPLVSVYIEYAHARKIVTVYGTERGKKERSFIELLDAEDRLRASYQQIGADTGRMSSYSPNFQQIPADGIGADLRRNVIAAPGYVLVVADFSNIELRIVAELSGDEFLLEAFRSGEDVHAYTAKVMFNLDLPEGVNLKKWTSEHNAVIGGRELENTSYRKIAKTINYMLLYGAGVRKLAAMLGVSESDARALLRIYYRMFEVAIAWLNERKEALEIARKAGEKRVYAKTKSGRRRWFDIPHYPKHPTAGKPMTVEQTERWNEAVDEWKRQMAAIKRQLANTPIQGLSADITKLAAARWYEENGYDNNMKLVAVIHDEFIVEAKDEWIFGVDEYAGGEDMTYAQYAQISLQRVMMEAMKTYLHRVDLGEIEPVVTPYWMH